MNDWSKLERLCRREFGDPVREAMAHGESAPAQFASWSTGECLRRLRIRFGLNRKQLAAEAGVSASLIGRIEKGADMRLSTLNRLYAALGCRLLTLPAGALCELDWRQARLDNEAMDWRKRNARHLQWAACVSEHSTANVGGEMKENANPAGPERAE
ncbi:MAG: helix-turn-helix domain-containing protein [Elusimicrobia bacterium]|nr:helix-turn-helix domain-containing protein [Elusimicrobiota bacterium]